MWNLLQVKCIWVYEIEKALSHKKRKKEVRKKVMKISKDGNEMGGR